MIKNLIILITFFISATAWSCPGCAGSMDNPGDQNTVYILMVFIGLTYIPFYFLYKMIFKHRKLNSAAIQQGSDAGANHTR